MSLYTFCVESQEPTPRVCLFERKERSAWWKNDKVIFRFISREKTFGGIHLVRTHKSSDSPTVRANFEIMMKKSIFRLFLGRMRFELT